MPSWRCVPSSTATPRVHNPHAYNPVWAPCPRVGRRGTGQVGPRAWAPTRARVCHTTLRNGGHRRYPCPGASSHRGIRDTLVANRRRQRVREQCASRMRKNDQFARADWSGAVWCRSGAPPHYEWLPLAGIAAFLRLRGRLPAGQAARKRQGLAAPARGAQPRDTQAAVLLPQLQGTQGATSTAPPLCTNFDHLQTISTVIYPAALASRGRGIVRDRNGRLTKHPWPQSISVYSITVKVRPASRRADPWLLCDCREDCACCSTAESACHP